MDTRNKVTLIAEIEVLKSQDSFDAPDAIRGANEEYNSLLAEINTRYATAIAEAQELLSQKQSEAALMVAEAQETFNSRSSQVESQKQEFAVQAQEYLSAKLTRIEAIALEDDKAKSQLAIKESQLQEILNAEAAEEEARLAEEARIIKEKEAMAQAAHAAAIAEAQRKMELEAIEKARIDAEAAAQRSSRPRIQF